MIDIFDRVKGYENEDREKTWGTEWVTYDIQENPKGWSYASPRKTTDKRRLYIGSYIYADNGFDADDKEKEKMLLQQKEVILSKIRKLSRYSHICKVDYCSIKSIQENQRSIGYDVLLRYIPKRSISEYAGTDNQKSQISHFLKDTSQEAESQRNQVAATLFEDLSHALQELSQAELPHGHINPEHVLLNTETKGAKFILSIPGYDRLLLSDEKDRKNTDFYTAPELVEDPNQSFDVQSDLYSVGLMLYQILNEGRFPFEADGISAEEAAKKRFSGNEEIPLPLHGSRILQYIARKACAHDRAVRYQSAEEMLSDLEHINSSVISGFDPMEICTLSLATKKQNEEERLRKEEEENHRKEEAQKKKQEEKQKRMEVGKSEKKRREQQQIAVSYQNPSSKNRSPSHTAMSDSVFMIKEEGRGDSAAVPLEGNTQTKNISVVPAKNNIQQNLVASEGLYNENIPKRNEEKKRGQIVLLIALIIVTIILLLLAIAVVKAVVNGSNAGDEMDSSLSASVRIENSEEDTTETEQSTEPSTEAEIVLETTIAEITALPSETTVEIAVKTAIGGAAPAATQPSEKTTTPVTQTGNYKFISGKYTWEQAEAYCEERGGHLATIHSESDWTALMQVVTDAQNGNSDLKYIWLGATSTLNDDMTMSFNWVDHSDTSYIMSTSFTHWFYNANIGQSEPSGYDAYEYLNSGTLIREPYLLLWYVAPSEGALKEWSLNDVPDVSDYANYKDSNMGFVMQLD